MIALLPACRYDKAEITPECSLPDTVSFSEHIIPLFNQHCNTPGCHTGQNAEANFDLSPDHAYEQLMEQGSGYIDTVNPELSVLYSAVISVSNPMPPTGRLDKCTTDLLLKWIQQKATNN